jgi:glyoxylase-like metal-dependent hydrolase (beta-lactamase superfamily II)
VDVQELRPGIWRWTARHPDWEPDEGLAGAVASVYYEAPDAVVLIDPIVSEDEEERFWAALDRDVERLGLPVVVLLTVPWHERSAAVIVERYGGSVATEPPRGVEAIRIVGVGGEPETIYWLPAARALVVGDILAGTPPRIIDAWQPEERRGEPVRAGLRGLLELPVELLLLSHGDAVTSGAREALVEALG